MDGPPLSLSVRPLDGPVLYRDQPPALGVSTDPGRPERPDGIACPVSLAPDVVVSAFLERAHVTPKHEIARAPRRLADHDS